MASLVWASLLQMLAEQDPTPPPHPPPPFHYAWFQHPIFHPTQIYAEFDCPLFYLTLFPNPVFPNFPAACIHGTYNFTHPSSCMCWWYLQFHPSFQMHVLVVPPISPILPVACVDMVPPISPILPDACVGGTSNFTHPSSGMCWWYLQFHPSSQCMLCSFSPFLPAPPPPPPPPPPPSFF